MHYDPIRSCLLANSDELESLGELVATGYDPAVVETWMQAGLVATASGGSDDPEDPVLVHPTLVGMASLLGRADRAITIERYANAEGQGQVAVMFVAWDRNGRCIMIEGAGDDQLQVTATQVRLLPGLLSQALRINPDAPTSTLTPVATTAAEIAAVFAPATREQPGEQSSLSFMGDISHAWRVTAGWADQQSDASLTVFNSLSQGFWSLTPPAEIPGVTPHPATTVNLEPLSPSEVLHQLGDAITGRQSAGDRPGQDHPLIL